MGKVKCLCLLRWCNVHLWNMILEWYSLQECQNQEALKSISKWSLKAFNSYSFDAKGLHCLEWHIHNSALPSGWWEEIQSQLLHEVWIPKVVFQTWIVLYPKIVKTSHYPGDSQIISETTWLTLFQMSLNNLFTQVLSICWKVGN